MGTVYCPGHSARDEWATFVSGDALWTQVDEYLSSKLLGVDRVLEEALEASNAAGLPAIAVSPNQGRLLEILVRIMGARTILEIGTLAGYSTIWMARALPKNGRLVTIEIDAKHAEVARGNIAKAGVSSVVELFVGSAVDVLPRLASDKGVPFDLIFIDADKANIPVYFEWAIKLSRQGSLIIVDNVVRDGAIIDETNADPAVVGVRKFLETVGRNSSVSSTAIQTVGIKGYDGFAIVLRLR